MAESTIGVDLDLVIQNIQKLNSLKDVVPSGSAMERTSGLKTGVGATYHSRLAERATEFAARVEAIRVTLESSRAAIQQTVDQFVALDSEHAADAEALMASIDSMTTQDQGSNHTAATSAGALANAGDVAASQGMG